MTQSIRDTSGQGWTELMLVKGRHRWVFRFERGQEIDALHCVAQAAGVGGGLDWTDAAILARQLGFSIGEPCEDFP